MVLILHARCCALLVPCTKRVKRIVVHAPVDAIRPDDSLGCLSTLLRHIADEFQPSLLMLRCCARIAVCLSIGAASA
jgi:hypothetical protein